MIRSLGTGVSGLNNHQLRMDVVGNNIANVNTVAFKKSRAVFNEMLAQEIITGGRFPGGTMTNPNFVGLGIRVTSIDKSWVQGSFENTNNRTDLAISGDGFFMVRDGNRHILTRAGNFALNQDGVLSTAGGLPVQGFAIDPVTGQTDTTQIQDLVIDLASTASPVHTSNIQVGGNLDAAMSINGGVNPDTFNMSTLVYDSQGGTHTVNIAFEKTSADGASPDTYQVTVSGDPTLMPFGAAPTVFNVEFDAAGQLTTVDGVAVTDPAFVPPQLTWDPAFVNVTGTDPVTINLTSVTQYSGTSSATVTAQDGSPSGQLVNYLVNPQGTILLTYDTGVQQAVGQLAMARVNNPGGLEQLGENFFGETGVSGIIQRGRAGNEINAAVVSGALEMSNVELAQEFAEMIRTQRGFQANARMIRTSDEMLTETVNLKR